MKIDRINETITGAPTVDGRNIGRKSYDMLKEDDQAVVAFGMSPLWLMEMIEKELRFKLGAIYAEHYHVPKQAEGFGKALKKEYINEIMTQVHLGLMDAAKEKRRMIT